MFAETKFFHKAGEGSGGGSDPHNLGYYADLTALQTAHTTGTDGDFAILGSTDTIWVWDSGTSAWKDTDTKGQVTSVNGQTGAVTVSEVPSQTGQSGKFLTTDGTDASWGAAAANWAKGTGSFVIGYSSDYNYDRAGYVRNTVICGAANYTSESVVVGNGAIAQSGGSNSVVIGRAAASNAYRGVAIGNQITVSAQYAVQIGGFDVTNSDANTFKVGNANGNFELMSADGTIPKERLTKFVTTPSTAPVLAVADWSSNTQTITVTGVTATNTVFVAPAPASAADYAAAGILCTAQAADSLTFTCTTVPSNAITLSVVILG